MTEFKQEMSEFKRETNHHVNRIDRRLRFTESDYEQANERIDKLELNDKR